MSYQDECQEVLQRIARENASVRGLSYFLNTVDQWHAGFAGEASEDVARGESAETVTTPQVHRPWKRHT